MTTLFLGIEIGGTKLQAGIGRGDGTLNDLWRSERHVLAVEGDRALASRQDIPAPIRHGSVRQQDERSLGRSAFRWIRSCFMPGVSAVEDVGVSAAGDEFRTTAK